MAVIAGLLLLIVAPLSAIEFNRNLGTTTVPPAPELLGAVVGAFIIPVAGLLLGWKRYSKKTGLVNFIALCIVLAGLSAFRLFLNFS